MTQCLHNWNQDFEMALWNAGLDDREVLLAGIDFCEEAATEPAKWGSPAEAIERAAGLTDH